MTSNSRVSQTENEIVENFLREQHEESFSYNELNGALVDAGSGAVGTFEDETTLTEDIRKIARALAPQISELEDVLKDFTETETADALEHITRIDSNATASDVSRSMMEDEDDDLDDELTQLAVSEQALREELEFAASISALGSPSPIRQTKNMESKGFDFPLPVDLGSRLDQMQQPQPPPASRVGGDSSAAPAPPSYSLQDHADYLRLKRERKGLWYYISMTSETMPTLTEDVVKDYCLPVPFRKLKRIYGGLIFHDVWESKRLRAASQTQPRPSTVPPIKTPTKTASVNRLLQTPAKAPGNASSAAAQMPGTPFTMAVPPTPGTPALSSNAAADKPKPSALQQIKNSALDNVNMEEPLPVRTIAIRVRPDVLCGAIMEAAHHAFDLLPSDSTIQIMKRQGAHLRGAVYLPKKQLAYVADVQLCTQKNDDLERRLLLRFYHIQDDPDALLELGQILQRKQQNPSGASENGLEGLAGIGDNDVMAQERSSANKRLKQACSLIQRLMAAEQQEGGIKNMDHKQQSRYVELSFLLEHRLSVLLSL